MANYNLTQTGAQVQALLDAVASGYVFLGTATPTTTPDTTNPNVCYLATTPGTYTSFGSATLAEGYIAALCWNGSSWTKHESAINVVTDATPMANSTTPVQSGGVYEIVNGSPSQSTDITSLLSFTTKGYYKSNSVSVVSAGGTNIYSAQRVDISSYQSIEVVAPVYNAVASDTRACLVIDASDNILDAQTWYGYESTTNKKLTFDLTGLNSPKYILVSYSTSNCTSGVNVYGIVSGVVGINEEIENLKTNAASVNAVISAVTPKYIHISFDDMDAPFQWLATNYSTASNILSESFFSLLKNLHDTYGACFSLYCFSSGLSALAAQGDKFKSGLLNYSPWLRFGFHAQAGGISYDPDTTYTYSNTAASDYAQFVQNINTICGGVGERCIDQVVRLGYFEGSATNLLAIKNQSMGAYGFLCPDTPNGKAYYLSTGIHRIIWNRGHWFDAQNNLYFVSTNVYRQDLASDITLEDAKTQIRAALTGKIFAEVFMHQNSLYSDISTDTLYTNRGNIMLQAMCEVALDMGFKFDFTHLYNY